MEKPDAVVWRGGDPELPLTEQGLTVLGAPVGQVEFVQAQLTKKGAEHEALLEMIPQVPNVQVPWLLILFCAGGNANFLLRTVQPELTQEFARHHDATGPLSEKGSPHQHNASGSASCSVNAVDSWWVGHWELGASFCLPHRGRR